MLTPQQIQTLKSSSPQSSSPNAPMTLEQAKASFSPQTKVSHQLNTGWDERNSNLAKFNDQAVSDQFNQGKNMINEGWNKITAPGIHPYQDFKGVGEMGGGAITSLSSPIAPIIKPFATGLTNLAQAGTDNPSYQKFAMSPVGQAVSSGTEDVANYSNIIGAGVGAGESAPRIVGLARDVGSNISDAVSSGVDSVNNGIKGMIEKPEPTVAEQADNSATQLKKVSDDWAKPLSENKAAFNNARSAVEKSPDTPQFLSEQKLNPYNHIEDGKYNTEGTAQNLRDTAGKMSKYTLRPSLQMADYTTPKTPVDTIVKNAITEAKNAPLETAGSVKKIINNIKDEGEALKEKYPDGMGLTDMHDEKISYNANGGYKPYNSNADNNVAVSNRSLGSSMQKLVEDNAPKDIPVGDFNDYLSKYYKAADYLDAIHGKTAPVSLAQSIARAASKYGGAALARYLVPGGGDLVSTFAGYQIGKALEHAVENMTNPMRDTFLRNLKTTNPEAFTKVSNYIGNIEAESATRLKLPPPTPLGTEKNPIITPAPTTFEKASQNINTENSSPKSNVFSPASPNKLTQSFIENSPQDVYRSLSDKNTQEVIKDTLEGKREDFRLNNKKQLDILKNTGLISPKATSGTLVKVYRAAENGIGVGDNVSLTERGAMKYLTPSNGKSVQTIQVQLQDLVKSKGTNNEFIYFPKGK